MKITFKYLLLFSLLVYGTFVFAATKTDLSIPVKGKTMANKKLQSNTLPSVYSAAGLKVKTCQTFSIIDTKVTKKPYNLKYKDGDYVKGEWKELWIVNACGMRVNIPITFILNPSGATYSISMRDITLSK